MFGHRYRYGLATLTLALTACVATMPEAVGGSGAGPQNAMDGFRTVFNKLDAAGVANVFRSDGKLLPNGRPMITGNENIRAYWQGAFSGGVSHIDKTPVDLMVSGDLAVETNTYVVTFKDQRVAGKETLVWRRGPNNVWGIASDIWNNDK